MMEDERKLQDQAQDESNRTSPLANELSEEELDQVSGGLDLINSQPTRPTTDTPSQFPTETIKMTYG